MDCDDCQRLFGYSVRDGSENCLGIQRNPGADREYRYQKLEGFRGSFEKALKKKSAQSSLEIGRTPFATLLNLPLGILYILRLFYPAVYPVM